MSLQHSPDERLNRAHQALQGLSVGDAFGECFFQSTDLVEQHISQRKLPPPPWHFTDDTIMSLAIVEILEEFGFIHQDRLAKCLAAKYSLQPNRGYGGTAHRILRAIAEGSDWRTVAASVFDGMGSMGNGGAMRAAPVGAYFADNMPMVVNQARLSAEVTHSHPEGQAGAVAVAVATAHVTCGGNAEDLLNVVCEFTPDSETRTNIIKAMDLPRDYDVRTAVNALGNGTRLTSQDTVPFALWCVSSRFGNFEEALWLTVSGLGDRDTTCAIVGGILALADDGVGIPEHWISSRENLDSFGGEGVEFAEG